MPKNSTFISVIRGGPILPVLIKKSDPTMLYDTYGEEYLTFLRELNEILSINELAELDYL
jgi:hypothetical protein